MSDDGDVIDVDLALDFLPSGPEGRPTHNYTWDRLRWGRDWRASDWSADHKTVEANGNGYGLKAGHDILVTMNRKGGGQFVGLYRIGDDLEYKRNPPDFWTATLTWVSWLVEPAPR
jgi:hypothetical protein